VIAMRTADPQPQRAYEPLPGQTLDVVLDGGWRLPVRSAGAGTAEDELELVPPGGEAVLPGGAERCRAALEWRSTRGLVRREGELSVRDGLLVLSGPAEAVVMQRRDFARVRCAVRVAVLGPDAPAEIATRTVDLSAGGMLVEDATLLQLGDRVRWAIGIPADGELEGTGEVVRATPFGHRAVRFDGLSDRDDRRLASFVFAQEREGRGAGAQT
jgi:hypothetical protein